MLHTVTKELRQHLATCLQAVGAKSGRAADRDSALLWLIHNTGNAWGVCVTVATVKPQGTEQDRRGGRCDVAVRLYLAMTPGLPADADLRCENLQLAWAYVWSYMERVRWGSAAELDPPEEGKMLFTPRGGFLDGNRPMLPSGTAEFSRVVLKVKEDKARDEEKELLLATQEWTLAASLPVLVPAADTYTDNFYLPAEA